MSAPEVTRRSVEPVLVARTSRDAAGFGPEHMGPIVGALFEQLAAALATAGIPVRYPSIAVYTAIEHPVLPARVHVCFPVAVGTASGPGFEVAELPAIELAACLSHHGSMATIGQSWQALLDWVALEPGVRAIGASREVYPPMPTDINDWITELQIPIRVE